MCIRFFSLTKLMSPVLRHLSLVSCLVFGSLLVPLFALLGGQGLELSRDETGNVSERCVRVIFLDSWTGRHGVEEEGTHVTLGSLQWGPPWARSASSLPGNGACPGQPSFPTSPSPFD